MALTPNLIPSQIILYTGPIDAMTMFADTQVLTATGYLNNRNSGQLDLGGVFPNQISAAGRTEGIWNIAIPSVDYSSANETYGLYLLGSNDVNFGNGNVDVLASHDLAAASSGRVIPTILGASPTGTRIQIPFSNQMQNIIYRFLRAYAVIAGTTPSITMTSWITRAQITV
jgi:hypothetical protein